MFIKKLFILLIKAHTVTSKQDQEPQKKELEIPVYRGALL